jgi:hypothetical protein
MRQVNGGSEFFTTDAKETNMAEKRSLLDFDPGWIRDPVPWPYLLAQLDRTVLVQLATVQLQLQRTVLEGQLKANQQMLEIVTKAPKSG